MSNTFCPIPWIFQAVRNNGDVRICCQANVTKNQGVVRHEDGTSYNAGKHDMTEARTADFMNVVRKNMLEGRWSDECGRCKNEEDAGLNSRRQYEQHWNFKYEDALKVTNPDGSINPKDVPLVYYDLRFGNLCNLKCRMCGPTDSHSWYEDWLQVYGGDGFQDTHGYVKLEKNAKGRLFTNDYDWYNSNKFWDHIESNIPNMQQVYMAGGEPLMIERHYDFLQKCIDMGQAEKMSIEYNTNMTNLQPRVIKLWEHFKTVTVGASIDGYGDVNDYQRFPAKWPSVYKNLQVIDGLPSNVKAWLACTVTNLNVFHIPEFMKWKLTESKFKKINSSKKNPILTIHVAHSPATACIQTLPLEMKHIVKEKYDACKDWLITEDLPDHVVQSGIKTINNIVNFMMKEDKSSKWSWFCEYTKQIDKLRNQNILDVVPEYEPYFD
jgi:sulfatase maturation enzyme AslB (radical SAM superfamily)